MLYELDLREESSDTLRPLSFQSLGDVGRFEQDLEELLADHLFETLFEEAPLMPFFQERAYQGEADLYALNRRGDLIIFELKRGGTGPGALDQVLRYTQEAGRWSYSELARRYAAYTGGDESLDLAHQDGFRLDDPLEHDQFNRRQHLRVVGNAADSDLLDAVEYWKQQGLDISFLPYRIYEIEDQHYFEFFAKPNDRHSNPADRKGVLFDTNRSYDENAIWEMMEMARVAAYGDAQRFAGYLNPGDLVFYSHRGEGIVAGAEVVSGPRQDGPEETYCEVEFRTPVPQRGQELRAMEFSTVSDVTGESFWWARMLKVPYLDFDQAQDLLEALNAELDSD